MRRYVAILLVLVGCFTADWISRVAAEEQSAEHRCEVLASEYACQLECAHRENSSAERVVRVQVPAVNVSGVSVRHSASRSVCGVEPMRGIAAVASSVGVGRLYRLSVRAIDYYIYTLCVLRL